MAPDKGSDPGQDREAIPADALDTWSKTKGKPAKPGDSEDEDNGGSSKQKPVPADALDRWSQERASDGEDSEGDDEKDGKEKKKSVFSNPWVKYGGIALVVLLLIVALIWWLNARQYEDTDDAFIDTHIVHLSPQVAGRILRIAVNDNQLWRKGRLLA